MNGTEYQVLAMRTASGTRNESIEDKLLNGILGLVGEVGEVVDMVKKAMYQGHPLDTIGIAEELGDILWYVALIGDGIGVDMDTIMNENIAKLKRRYPDGFEVERSMERGE